MKKLLSLILVTVLCVLALASCDTVKGWFDKGDGNGNEGGGDEIVYNLPAAVEYVRALYISDNPVTSYDYEVVGQVMVKAVKYTVDWSVDNTEVKLTKGETKWTVDIDEDAASEYNYVLTATVIAGDGSKDTVSFNRTVPEKNIYAGVANPVEGVAYKFFMNQVKENKILYAIGTFGEKYLDTTQVATEAPDFFVEKSGDGFKFYFLDGETRMYIEAYLVLNPDDGHYSKRLKFSENGTVWTYNGETKSWWSPVLAETNLQYVIGTYGDFTTFSISETSYITAENTGKEQFPAGLLPKEIAETDNSTPEQKVENEIAAIEIPGSVKVDSEITLPIAGERYRDVVFAWESNNACAVVSEDGTKLTVTLPDEAVTVTLTLTATLGDVTKTETYEIAVSAKPADGKVILNKDSVFPGITGTSYSNYNGDHTVGNLAISTTDVMGNKLADFSVLQFKKQTGTFIVKNVSVSSMTFVILSTYDYSDCIEVKIGDTVITLPAADVVNAAGEATGVLKDGQYEVKRYTITVELEAPLSGDLTITDTANFAVYFESIEIQQPKTEENFIRENVFPGITGTSYSNYNGDHTVGNLAISTTDVMGNKLADFSVLQFKKQTGTFIVKNVSVSSMTFVILSTYDYSDCIEVKIGDTVITLPAADVVNAAGEATGVLKDGQYEVKRYTITVELEAPLSGDLTITDTANFAVYFESINIKFALSANTHEHDYVPAVTAPTCTVDGYTTYTCACGDSYTEPGEAATGHTHVPAVTAPTCTAAGYTTYTCACSDSYTEAGEAATGHAYGDDGVCANGCGIPASHEHDYVPAVTAPTCTAAGYTVYTCACGDSYTEAGEAATGHTHVPAVTAPTCTAAGYTVYTCACGDSYTEPGEAALGHDDTDGDYKCDNGTCDELVLPAADSVLTLEQVIKIAACFANGQYTTDKYYVTGVIVDVYNTTYGNAHITDGTNQLTVYGLNQNGTRYDAMTVKPVAGDTITVYGIIGTYNNAAQFGSNNIKNELTNHVAHTCVPGAEATCTTAQTCTLCAKVIVEALGHNYGDDGICINGSCEDVKPAEGSTTTTTVDFSTLKTNTSYGSGTVSGWNYTSTCILSGGASDSNPKFIFIGDESVRALCLNGSNKAGKGTLTSDTITTGVSKISFNYGLPYSGDKVNLTINVKKDGVVVATETISATPAQKSACSFEWTLDTAITGNVVIEIINSSTNTSTSSNKDRVAIWDLQYVSAPVEA